MPYFVFYCVALNSNQPCPKHRKTELSVELYKFLALYTSHCILAYSCKGGPQFRTANCIWCLFWWGLTLTCGNKAACICVVKYTGKTKFWNFIQLCIRCLWIYKLLHSCCRISQMYATFHFTIAWSVDPRFRSLVCVHVASCHLERCLCCLSYSSEPEAATLLEINGIIYWQNSINTKSLFKDSLFLNRWKKPHR